MRCSVASAPEPMRSDERAVLDRAVHVEHAETAVERRRVNERTAKSGAVVASITTRTVCTCSSIVRRRNDVSSNR